MMGNGQLYFIPGTFREQGGHETSLIDPTKVETETGKATGPHPLPKRNKLCRSADVRNRGSSLDKKKFESHKGIYEIERLNLCRQRSATVNADLALKSMNTEGILVI